MSKLLLVDDHAIVRAGLRRLLESIPCISHIEECASGEAAYQYLFSNTVDIILMDISMPGKGGIESTSLIKKRYPQTKVLILSMHDSAVMIRKAKNAGASGFVLKNEISDITDKMSNQENLTTEELNKLSFHQELLKQNILNKRLIV